MEPQLIAGLVFAGVTVLFFMVAYFFKPPTPSTAPILRILSSVCAGASGAFLSGSLALNVDGQLAQGARFGITAGGAVALFVLVWLTFKTIPLAQEFRCSLPIGATFQQAAWAIGQAARASVNLIGFRPSEEATTLTSFNIRERDPEGALRALARMVPQGSVRPYKVTRAAGSYTLST